MTGPKTAFVLAGGGTKGAFEAGAIRYLVEEEQILPQILTAASAGAVAAAVLAQARTREEFAQRSAELRQDLLAMTHIRSALRQATLGRVPRRHAVRAGDRQLPHGADATGRSRGPELGHPWPRPTAPAATGGRSSWRPGSPAPSAGCPAPDRELRGNTGSVLTLDPLARALRNGGPSGILPVDPALIARPGMQLGWP